MVEVVFQYESCVRDDLDARCHEPVFVGAGRADNARVICDRMWPETCYVCESGERWPSECRVVPREDPCKRNPIDPWHDILPKECGEKGKQPRPIFEGEGKQKEPQKKTGSYVPTGAFYSWTDTFNRFSETPDGFVGDGEALAYVNNDREDNVSDRPQKDEAPEKPEGERHEKPESPTKPESPIHERPETPCKPESPVQEGPEKPERPDTLEKPDKSHQEGSVASADLLDDFSESYDGYMEEGDGLALRDKDEDEDSTDSTDDKPEKPEKPDRPDKPERDVTQEKIQQLRTEEKQLRDEAYSESWKAMRDGVGSLNPYEYGEHAIKANQKDWEATKKQWEADRLENQKKREEEEKAKKK